MVGILERLGQAFENLEPLFLIVQASAQILLNTSKSCLLLSISLVVFTASYLFFDFCCNALVLFLRRIKRNIKKIDYRIVISMVTFFFCSLLFFRLPKTSISTIS